jgi:signal peptidase
MLTRIFEALATVLLVMAILVSVGIFVSPKVGWQVDAVYGGSMEPAIKLGSLAVIRPVEPQDVRVGDVITFRSSTESNTVTTHRVIEVANNDGSLVFHTQGDANEDPDPYTVPAENVLGRVWMSVPYAGYFTDFVRSPLGLGLLIGIPAAIIIGIELRNIFRSIGDLRRKRENVKRYVRQASK